MKIALIDPSLFTLPYDSALALGLTRAGGEVTLHGRALRPTDEPPDPLSVSESFYHVSDGRLGSRLPPPLRLGLKGLDHGWSLWRLAARLQRNPPDVIHFQWLPLPLMDRLFLQRFRRVAPIVLTVHDTNPFNGASSAVIQRRGIDECLTQFDRLIVHTKQGEARLRRSGIAADRITVLPHGMLTELAPDVPDPMTGRLTFLLFGKIRPYKGTDIAIKAYAALPAALRARARLRVVGQPYVDLAPLQALARAAGGSVELETGFVSEGAIAGLFGQGTVAVFPYREIEASGVLFLALAYGRPIIASRLGSFAELLGDGRQGPLLPPGDVDALTAAMARMLTEPGFAAACAAASRQLASDIPSWDEIARRTLTTYRQAMGQHPAATVPLPGVVRRSAAPP